MKLTKPKYIFVTGGVASSLGKGIISASIARLLQARGYSVTIQKLDPYINVDPGTLNPYEHGECYVTEDGAETDLDLGHYERFTNHPTSKANNVTTGKIYKSVIEKERKGEYLGKTVQVIPHITDEIRRRIQLLGQTKKYDVIITEIGGTVGDIESLPFIESVRQLRYQLGHKNTALVHLTLIPYMAASGELKTKPTQHSVKVWLGTVCSPTSSCCAPSIRSRPTSSARWRCSATSTPMPSWSPSTCPRSTKYPCACTPSISTKSCSTNSTCPPSRSPTWRRGAISWSA